MKTWSTFLLGLAGNTVWEAAARNVARFVLALPDDATDEQIEAAREQAEAAPKTVASLRHALGEQSRAFARLL